MKRIWNKHDLVTYASQQTGLSQALCKELLEKGWTLVFKINEAHTWVSPIHQLEKVTVEEVTSHGVKVKDKDNEQEKQPQSISSVNSTVRDFMGSHGMFDVNTAIVGAGITPQQRADVLSDQRVRHQAHLAR